MIGRKHDLCGWIGLIVAVILQAVTDAARGNPEAREWLEAQGIDYGRRNGR